jgi:hypothetical protein
MKTLTPKNLDIWAVSQQFQELGDLILIAKELLALEIEPYSTTLTLF